MTKKERKKKQFTSLRLKHETAKKAGREKERKEDKIKEKERERKRKKEKRNCLPL